jgi:uncharacterized protein YdeI (YjbR/CyaY-like superfamily)
MPTSKTNPAVDRFVKSATKWRPEIEKLRAILLGCPLTEDLKWGKPCYTFQEANVVVIVPLKNYCALIFAKGALITDTAGLLIQPTANSQAQRQFRFTSLREIGEKAPILKDYVRQAIEAEKAGRKVVYKQTADYAVPDELSDKFKAAPDFKAAFESLTSGRQRAYLLHFAGAKQSATRAARIEKYALRIINGKGMLDT